MKLILGIDLGTSYFKAALFDCSGQLRGLGRTAVEPRVQGPRVELPPEMFWQRLRQALAEALEEARAASGDIAALSISSQANTFLLLDDHGEPLTPLLLWSDRRVHAVPAPLRRLWSTRTALQQTGRDVVGPTLAVCKALWFCDKEPQRWARAHRLVTLSEYLVFSLTGRPVVDTATAGLLGLLDIRNRCWWEPALQLLGWDREFLGTPAPPGTPAGTVHAGGHRLTGLPEGLPVTVGTLDHYAAALGAGVGHHAPYSVSLGTVLALVEAAATYAPGPAYVIGDGVLSGTPRFCRMAFDAHGAGILEHYRKTCRPEHSFAELSALAAKAPPGSGEVLALPENHPMARQNQFLGGGCTPNETGHEVRAIMELTAASLLRLRSMLAVPPEAATVATGGGARSDIWMQVLSDVTGAPFLRAACPEPACLGAALLAAAGIGWFPSVEQAAHAWTRCTHTVTPDPEARRFYTRWYRERARRLA